jgi:hypothetical protein
MDALRFFMFAYCGGESSGSGDSKSFVFGDAKESAVTGDGCVDMCFSSEWGDPYSEYTGDVNSKGGVIKGDWPNETGRAELAGGGMDEYACKVSSGENVVAWGMVGGPPCVMKEGISALEPVVERFVVEMFVACDVGVWELSHAMN